MPSPRPSGAEEQRGIKKGSLSEPLGLRPFPPGWGGLGKSVWSVDSAARVLHLVQTLNTGGAGQTIPVVATALTPAIEPGLPGSGMSKRTEVARFSSDAVLITAQKGSFQRITLKSSHRVLPSLVDCYVPLAPLGGRAENSANGAHCRRDTPRPSSLR